MLRALCLAWTVFAFALVASATPQVTLTSNTPYVTMYENPTLTVQVTGAEDNPWTATITDSSQGAGMVAWPDTLWGGGDGGAGTSVSIWTPGSYEVTASLTFADGYTTSASTTVALVTVSPDFYKGAWEGYYYLRAGESKDIPITVSPAEYASQITYAVSGDISIVRTTSGYTVKASPDAGYFAGGSVSDKIDGIELGGQQFYVYDLRLDAAGLTKEKKQDPGTAMMLNDSLPVALTVPYIGQFELTLTLTGGLETWIDGVEGQSFTWNTAQGQFPPTMFYVEGVESGLGAQVQVDYTGAADNPVKGPFTDSVKIGVLDYCSEPFPDGPYYVARGTTKTFPLATTVPSGAGNLLTYISANPNIATVSNEDGHLKVVGKTAGTTQVTAYVGGIVYGQVAVNVISLDSLTVSGATEFTDPNDDANTKSYAVGIAAEGVVTVTATPNMAVSEDILQSIGWTLSGGEGDSL
ncbi:MAG TPA: hypothetical protein VGL77_20840, partial [Armatimonadota bacterium]